MLIPHHFLISNHYGKLFRKPLSLCFLGTLVLTAALSAQTEHPSHPTHHDLSEEHSSDLFVRTMWDSKYVSEGRDNLGEGGLGSASVGWTYTSDHNGELIFGGWYAEGTSVDYTELNLGVAYGWSLEKLDIAVGYTWLDYAETDASDNEFAIEAGTSLFDDYDVGAVFIYSDEAGGAFFEFVVSKSFEEGLATWTPYLLLGINDGFVATEHEGLNNLQMGVEVSASISEHFELSGYLAYTIGLDENAGDTLDDLFWVGVSLGWAN